MAILFDFETLDNKPTAIVLDLAVVHFDENKIDNFQQLVNDSNRIFYRKFDTDQKGRTAGHSTLDWWKQQEAEVRKILKPTPNDVSLEQGMLEFKSWLEMKRHSLKWDNAYVRGQSFDFPLMADITDRLFDTWGLGYSLFPCSFWNQFDVRTALKFALHDIKLKKVPVAKGTFNGFIKHNAIHDCAKDAILIQTVLGYAKGTVPIPDLNDCDWI
jgi:hypothetical protein